MTPTHRAARIMMTGLAFIASSGVSAQAQQAGQTSSGSAGEDGGAYAEFGCGACHGAEGRGTALGPSIATGALTLPDFIDYLRRPTGTMPPYTAQTVSAQLLTDMHAYLDPPVAEPVPAGRVEMGAALYQQTGCYQCHANEGQGGAQGPRIGPDPVTFARFGWYVRNPSGGMPPYTELVMSDQDLADIYAFLRTRPQPPAVDSIPLLAP